MKMLFRQFHATAWLMNRPWHPLYKAIQWDRVKAGHIAVVDPADATGILYLSEKDYKIQVRVSLSQDLPLVVLARPGDEPASSSTTTQTTPTPSPSSSSRTKEEPKVPRGPTPTITQALKEAEEIEMDSTADPEDPQVDTKEEKSPAGTQNRRSDVDQMTLAQFEQYLEKLGAEVKDEKSSKAYNRALRKAQILRDRVSGGWGQFFSWYLSSLGPLAKLGGDNKGPMVTASRETVMSLVYRWGLILDYRLGGPLVPSRSLRSALAKLARDLGRIYATQGPQALIMKMKNTMLFMNHYLSGNPVKNPWLLGTPVGLARSGIPRVIPLVIRRRIASGCTDTIRLMESILSSYKVIEGTYELQTLDSVVGNHPILDSSELSNFADFCKNVFWPITVKSNCKAAGKLHLMIPKLAIPDDQAPYIPLRAGPNNPVGLLGAHYDAFAWSLAPRNYVLEWCKHIGDERTPRVFEASFQHIQQLEAHYPSKEELFLGKVCMLYEPAGKVRTIAVVDYWTQRVMHPVHQWMMQVLSTFESDGTFNQINSVKSFAEQNHETVWSIDLKSATDLIPLELYETLLRGIWPEERVALWSLLLTDRWFKAPEEGVVDTLPRVVRYNRGQPMGTLSSWASMALLHHAIVQYSAYKADKNNARSFSKYRVLGDDVVIGCALTAAEYLNSTKLLQIPISLPKTVTGKLFIFASQIYLNGVSVSPSSVKEELGVRSFTQRLEMALRAVSRGWISSKPTISRFLRHLLTRKLYKSSVKAFVKGKLGRAAQAAMISAFGVGERVLQALKLQGSQMMPFLLALQDKVTALVGDPNRLDQGTLAYIKDAELILATAMVQRVRCLAKERLDSLIAAGVNWSEWVWNMESEGVLPYGAKHTWGPPMLLFPNPTLYQRLHDRALWPILLDSYELFFGVQSEGSYSADYTDAINDDLGMGEEDLGMGMTFTADPASAHITTGGWSLQTPILWKKASGVVDRLDEILRYLVRGEDLERVNGPTHLVDEAIQILSDIPRVPDFTGMESLIPNRDPKSVDALRAWVRQVRDFETTLRYLPLASLKPAERTFADLEPELEAVLDLSPLRLPTSGSMIGNKVPTPTS